MNDYINEMEHFVEQINKMRIRENKLKRINKESITNSEMLPLFDPKFTNPR